MTSPSESPKSPSDRASVVAAFAFVFALASLLFQLACTLGMTEFELDSTHIDPSVVRAGALLRVPFSLLLGALLGATASNTKGATRFLLPSLLAAPFIYLDVCAYRVLATTGELPRLAVLLGPRELFRGPFATTAILSAVLMTVAGLLLSPLLVRFFERRYARRGIALADGLSAAFGSLLTLGAIMAGTAAIYDGSVPPAYHLFAGKAVSDPASVDEHSHDPDAPDPEPTDGIATPPRDLRELVYSMVGVEAPLPIASPAYPFCRAIVPDAHIRRRSVLLVVLDGVGSRELGATFGEARAMPNLARIAEDGVSFTKFFASSTDPAEGLVSILGGVLPVLPTPWTSLSIPPSLPAIATDLGNLGIGTYFVHSTDLGIDRVRTLARTVGFTTIDGPAITPSAATTSYARSDADSVVRLEEIVTRHRASDAEKPYFVAATLYGAAAPYAIPTNATPIATGDSEWDRFGNAIHATDAALGDLYAWYRANEASKGTVLVITSAHASSLARPGEARNVTSPQNARLELPLVVAGLTVEELREARTAKNRVGSQVDIAQTLLGLLGLLPSGCYQGHDMLSQLDEFPTLRLAVSTAGNGGRFVIANDGALRWVFDRTAPELGLHAFATADDALATNVVEAHRDRAPQMTELVLSLVAIGSYLSTNDRFVDPHPPTADGGVAAVAAVATSTRTPLVAPAHATVVAALGAEGGSFGVADIAKARSRGFETVRLAVEFDGTTPKVRGAPATSTLAEVLQRAGETPVVLSIASPPHTGNDAMLSARALVAAVGPIERGRLVLVTPDVELAISLSTGTPHPVYLDSRSVGVDSVVPAATRFGLDGVALDGTGSELIPAARTAGLHVVVEGAWPSDAVSVPDYVVTTSPAP